MANDLMAAFVQTPGFPDCRPKPTCDPRPPCPACGGLECLCRPRFFAGQLLTDDDLNRLDYYIVEKNRLHNRYLVGTGVVCGLEVVCSICDPAGNGTVVVRPGYALSPCGNDIVVCGDERSTSATSSTGAGRGCPTTASTCTTATMRIAARAPRSGCSPSATTRSRRAASPRCAARAAQRAVAARPRRPAKRRPGAGADAGAARAAPAAAR